MSKKSSNLGKIDDRFLILCLTGIILFSSVSYLKSQTLEAITEGAITEASLSFEKEIDEKEAFYLPTAQKNTFLSHSELFFEEIEDDPGEKESFSCAPKRVNVVVTGYSSTPWETDDTPYITASGISVREGIVAANFLPFGTKIKIPQLFGDKIFVVEDRMHHRYYYNVDIWFPEYQQALEFGRKNTYIEIIEDYI